MESGTQPDAPAAALGPEAVAEAVAALAAERLADVEFSTFRCGCGLPQGVRGGDARSLAERRAEVRSALRRRLEAAWPGRRHRNDGADVTIDARFDGRGVVVRVAPLHVAGRYLKLARGISQTVFHCRRCRGRPGGCERCAGTGRLFAEAVEDFVLPPVKSAAAGAAASFHGAGREDVDVRMLGNGRPFVVTVRQPRRRALDLGAVAAAVEAASAGRVVLRDLAVVDLAERRRRTTEHGVKTYRATIVPADGDAGDARFPEDAADRLRALAGAEVAQRTPHRVEARRADLVRRRSILGLDVEESGPRRVVVVLRTDPGTYVKEFVTGDDGRTEPSVASALGADCSCEELDVLDVSDGSSSPTTSSPPCG